MSQGTIEKPPGRSRPPGRLLRRSTAAHRPWDNPARSRRPSLLGISDDLGSDNSTTQKSGNFFYLSPFARLRISALVITIFALAIIVKLFSWQVQKESELKDRAAAMRVWETEIPSRRGLILDANGLILASNVWVYSIYAAPESLTESQSQKITDKLARLLPDVPVATVKDAVTFTSKKKNYNLIASGVSSEVSDDIRKLQLPGIFLEAKPRRTYPNGNFMSQLLGFANNENQGAYGIEGEYNKELRGTPGTRLAEHDRDGNPIVLGQVKLKESLDGGDVRLTIDSSIQYLVERELKKGMEEHSAEKAMAIVADPQTGAILAWSSFPNYNPNEFYKTDPQLLRDPIVSDIYEPGSTFKILTAAIGIDTGVVTPESSATLPGCVLKYGRTICNFDKVGYTNQTVTKSLEKSSNVGMMWVAEKFGPDKFYDYIKKFGIGTTTGIDLSGEGEGILRTNKDKGWGPLDFLTNSFGQSVAITPIQLVQAVSAVANGGKLMKPYVVQSITRDSELLMENKPTFVRQVISPESARITTNMLVSAVRLGETRLADVKGYRVAGKTGTATLYDSDFTIGSTIAYAPADNPRFVVLVRYDKTKDTPWGSNTAAPVVKTITEQLFNYYKIPPTEIVKTR